MANITDNTPGARPTQSGGTGTDASGTNIGSGSKLGTQATQDRDATLMGASGSSKSSGAKGGRTGEARKKLEDATSEWRSKATAKGRETADRTKGQAAEGLTGFAEATREAARKLREKDQGPIADYTDKAAEQIDRFATTLRNKSVDEMLQDARHYAREYPGIFLGLAVGAGFAISRFLKSSVSDDSAGHGYESSSVSAVDEEAGLGAEVYTGGTRADDVTGTATTRPTSTNA